MIWIVVSSFIAALVLAFGLGANDVSNAFATSIGAKVITLRTACLIASIAEMAGSLGLGGLVTESVINTTLLPSVMDPRQTMLVMFCSLVAVSLWLLLATWLKLPVSATHAVISSIIGATLVANRSAVNWRDLNRFLVAWVVAPLLSGIISIAVFYALRVVVLAHRDSFSRGIAAVPFIYVLTIGVNVCLIAYQVLKKTGAGALWISLSAGLVLLVCAATFLFARLYLVPFVKRRIFLKFKKAETAQGDVTPDEAAPFKGDFTALEAGSIDKFLFSADATRMALQTEQLFSFLQILSAVFTSFVHGSNDVSNSVGPLYGLYNAYLLSCGADVITPSSPITYGLLAYGGAGMVLGLYVWGARVIETIGENLTPITPSKGFCIEFGSALTVLVASMMQLSVSTTHCKVGSIVCVGMFAARYATESSEKTDSTIDKTDSQSERAVEVLEPAASAVNPKLIFSIVASWVCTIPFAGLLAAGLYYLIALFIF